MISQYTYPQPHEVIISLLMSRKGYSISVLQEGIVLYGPNKNTFSPIIKYLVNCPLQQVKYMYTTVTRIKILGEEHPQLRLYSLFSYCSLFKSLELTYLKWGFSTRTPHMGSKVRPLKTQVSECSLANCWGEG